MRMTEKELYDLLGARFEESISEQWGQLILEEGLFDEAMNIALTQVGHQPFRAAYALEKAFFKAPDQFTPYHARFIGDFCTATHPSVWRHYGKIMACLLKKQIELTDEEATRIAETACMRLVDESIRVAVRVWSLDILQHLSGRVTWIDRELPAIIEQLSIAPSPGMISRLRKLGYIRK